MDIDYPAKGRTAKKISKDEFEEHLKDFYEKYCRDDDYWRGKYDRNKRLKPGTFINGALKYNKKIPKKLRDDLNEIEHDEKNMEAIGDIQITNGIPYIQGCVGGDWESAIFLYYIGMVRIYVDIYRLKGIHSIDLEKSPLVMMTKKISNFLKE